MSTPLGMVGGMMSQDSGRQAWATPRGSTRLTPIGIPAKTPDLQSDMEALDVPRPSSTPAGRNLAKQGARRKPVRNWGGMLGQQMLITVPAGLELVRAPWTVAVHYDLRSVVNTLEPGAGVFVAVLDAEKLRRSGSGSGLNPLQASESWLARDCICCSSGKLRPLTNLKGPDKIQVTLNPLHVSGEKEACVLLRVVVISRPSDPRDWRAIGASVVLQVDTEAKLLQPGSQGSQEQRQAIIANSSAGSAEHGEAPPKYGGVTVRQLTDFFEVIRPDLAKYISAHRVCQLESSPRCGYHVCMYQPCPFKPLKTSVSMKDDDHRGIPYVGAVSLSAEEEEKLEDMVPDVQLVLRRYARPKDKGFSQGREQEILAPRKPLKTGVYVSHSWTEPFNDFMDTLRRALDKEDVIFMPRLALADAEPWPKGGDYVSMQRRNNAVLGLRRSDKLVIIADKALGFARCLQCGYEIWEAKEGFLPCFLWPHRDLDLMQLKVAVDPTSRIDNKPESIEGRTAAKLTSFLEGRILCYALALQEASESKNFTLEKLQQLHTEYERRMALREAMQNHEKRKEELQLNLQNKEAGLEKLKQTLESEREAHAKECEESQRQLDAGRRSKEQAQEKCKELEARIDDLEHQLKDADAELASLESQELEGHLRAEKLKQLVEEERRIADEEERLADEETRRVEALQAAWEKERADLEEETRHILSLQQEHAQATKRCNAAEAAEARVAEELRELEKQQPESDLDEKEVEWQPAMSSLPENGEVRRRRAASDFQQAEREKGTASSSARGPSPARLPVGAHLSAGVANIAGRLNCKSSNRSRTSSPQPDDAPDGCGAALAQDQESEDTLYSLSGGQSLDTR